MCCFRFLDPVQRTWRLAAKMKPYRRHAGHTHHPSLGLIIAGGESDDKAILESVVAYDGNQDLRK